MVQSKAIKEDAVKELLLLPRRKYSCLIGDKTSHGSGLCQADPDEYLSFLTSGSIVVCLNVLMYGGRTFSMDMAVDRHSYIWLLMAFLQLEHNAAAENNH